MFNHPRNGGKTFHGRSIGSSFLSTQSRIRLRGKIEVNHAEHRSRNCQRRPDELLESVPIPEGTRVLVTLIPEETNSDFWQKVSEMLSLRFGIIWKTTSMNDYSKLEIVPFVILFQI